MKDQCLKHEPNWNTLTTEEIDGRVYIDVCCKHCGESGCVAIVGENYQGPQKATVDWARYEGVAMSATINKCSNENR